MPTAEPPACVLKVSRAVLIKMPHFRRLRPLILKNHLAIRANTLRLLKASPAAQFDVMHDPISAEMPGYREIIDNANGGQLFHFLR